MNVCFHIKILAFLLTSTVAFANSLLSENGVYQAGKLGLLLIEREGNRMTGKYLGGGPCNFEWDQPLLDGQYEADVFTGTLILCQVGPNCQNRTVPFMGFFNAVTGVLSGDVMLDDGCHSTALDGRRFRLARANAEDKKAISFSQADRASKALGGKRKPNRAAMRRFREALSVGNQLLKSKDFAAAVVQFELSLSYVPQNPQAHLGLGLAEMNRGNVLAAMAHLSMASKLPRLSKSELRDLHLNWANAYAILENPEEVLAQLKLAVKYGAKLPEGARGHSGLQRLMERDRTLPEIGEGEGLKSSKRKR